MQLRFRAVSFDVRGDNVTPAVRSKYFPQRDGAVYHLVIDAQQYVADFESGAFGYGFFANLDKFGRLIGLGVDILDPIQVTATGMDPSYLKSEFGDRLCLHGAIDTQHLLPRGSPSDVTADVRRMIEELGPNGYIMSPSHVLQTDVPTANVRALYQAERQY